MLRHLRVTNYALIRDLEVDFASGLTAITGETGAGKSILLGALGLVLGKRADTRVLHDRDRKCVVEARFDVSAYALEALFEAQDLDWEPETILRREITGAGRSRAFVNDTPVRLEILAQIGLQLVHIHSQHETLDLGQSRFQTQVLDAWAGNGDRIADYARVWRNWSDRQRELTERREAHANAIAERDYLQFQFDELEAAALDDLDAEALEAELSESQHAEEIKRALGEAAGTLTGEETGAGSVVERLQDLAASLGGVARWKPEIEAVAARIDSIRIEAEDVAGELERLDRETGIDEDRIAALTETLDGLNRLLVKHRKPDATELIALREELSEKLYALDTESHDLGDLETEVERLGNEVIGRAEELHAERVAASPGLSSRIDAMLAEVGMPSASLQIEVEAGREPGPRGTDRVRFLFRSNKGSRPEELQKVASGGELSRLMLCIKSLLAESASWPTLLFDEIDAGISGETGRRVGALLGELAGRHQVIAITHLPQIAACGERHLFVYKEEVADRTESRIRPVSAEERVEHIARMLSGDQPSEAARENARELLA